MSLVVSEKGYLTLAFGLRAEGSRRPELLPSSSSVWEMSRIVEELFKKTRSCKRKSSAAEVNNAENAQNAL